MLGAIVFYKLVFSHQQAFGETMMFLYYGYMLPLSRRIGRGFYQDGIWAEAGFIPYNEVGGLSWREGEHAVALVVISRLQNLARRAAGADRALRRGTAPATRQDRRACDPLHRDGHRPRGAR